MTKIEIVKLNEDQGAVRFSVDAGYMYTESEQAYVGRMDFLNVVISGWVKEDTNQKEESIKNDLVAERKKMIDILEEEAKKFAELPVGPQRDESAKNALAHSFFFEGATSERRDRIRQRPFEVAGVYDKGNQSDLFADIEIKARDVFVSEEKLKLKVRIDRTAAIFKTVIGQKYKHKLHEYMLSLVKIAEVGLMNTHPSQSQLASLALTGLQEEFCLREAAGVKNEYVVRLSRWAFSVAVICFAMFFATEYLPHDSVPFTFRRFFLLGCGASIGAWLSFSLRKVTFSFDDLAILDEDKLSPPLKILFVLMLTSVVGLLFWTKATVIQIGGFTSDFRMNGTFAILIGALCGISERGLANAVIKRAGEFAASIGGKSENG